MFAGENWCIGFWRGEIWCVMLAELKIYERYIISKILGPFLLITVGITGIAWLSQSLRFIDLIVNKGLSIVDFMHLSVLILPALLWVIVPAGTLISIIYAYNKLYTDNELVIFKAVGMDNKTLMRPALIFCLFAMLVSYSISLYLMPASYREFKDFQIYIRNNYASVLLQEGVFVTPTPGLTLYVREKDKLGGFKGLVVHDSRNAIKQFTITAQEATLENTDKGPVFVLKNGSHQEHNMKTGQFTLLYFTNYTLEINLFSQEMIDKRWRESTELYLYELFFADKPNESERLKEMAEGHNRITWPLYNVMLCMIALIPFVSGEFSRRGNGKKILTVSVISLMMIVFALAVKNIATKNIMLNILQYFLVISGISLSYFTLASDKADPLYLNRIIGRFKKKPVTPVVGTA